MVLLGYRDRNVHELVVHETALRAGSYARLGVDVQTVAGHEHPEAPLSAGLGGSLIETLKGHRTWCAGLVHTLHPFFWVWDRGEGAALTDLRTSRAIQTGPLSRRSPTSCWKTAGFE